jgi:hypothetical protein
VETNQPTNQHHCEQEGSYLPRLKLPPAHKARKLRLLAGSLVACGICVIEARLEIFFWRLREKKIAIAIAIAIFVKHVRDRFSLSRYKTVWGACEGASERASLHFFPHLFGFFRGFFFVFVFFPFKAGQTASVPGCSYVPYVPTNHV